MIFRCCAYFVIQKVKIHAGELRKLLYLWFVCFYGKIINSLKLADYLPVQTHKPYNNLHVKFFFTMNIRVEISMCALLCRIRDSMDTSA